MRTVLIGLAMAMVLASCGSGADPVAAPEPMTGGPGGHTTGASDGHVTPTSPASGGETVSSIGSCVEKYSLRTRGTASSPSTGLLRTCAPARQTPKREARRST
jgi:hypothetical protein